MKRTTVDNRSTRLRWTPYSTARCFSRLLLGLLGLTCLPAHAQTTYTLSGSVTLLEAINKAQPLTFTFAATNTTGLFTRSVTLAANGTFQITQIPAGKYNVAVQGDRWLRTTVAGVNLSTSNVTNFAADLTPGDANGDNSCDIFDLGALSAAFNSGPSDSNWNPRCDFNCSGGVDIFDLATLSVYFNTTGNTYAASLEAVTTGSGKIALYWRGPSDAEGYRLYRGTVAGGSTTMVNPTTLANTHNYAGSDTYLYTDTGLTNGVRYYYLVKGVKGGLESPNSNEGNAVPSANGIPWDSNNPADVVNAVRTLLLNNPEVDLTGKGLDVMGPDGRVYEEGATTVTPTTIVAEDGTAILPDGSTLMTPLEAKPNTPITLIGGPFHRVKTFYSLAWRGVRGTFYLPSQSQVGTESGKVSALWLYLGHSSQPDSSGSVEEVDLGLSYDGKPHATLGLGWAMTGQIARQSPQDTDKHFVLQTQAVRFPAGWRVTEIYLPAFTFFGLTFTAAVCEGYDPANPANKRGRVMAFTSRVAATSALQMKRVSSIAQKEAKDKKVRCVRQNFYFSGAQWHNGQILDATEGDWVDWNDVYVTTVENNTNMPPPFSAIIGWNLFPGFYDTDPSFYIDARNCPP